MYSGSLKFLFGNGQMKTFSAVSIDKVGPDRVSRWVAACNRILTSKSMFLFLAAVVASGTVLIFLSHTEGSHLGVFLNCAVREWRFLSVVGFAALAVVLYLTAVRQDRLRLQISGGKLERLLERLQGLILVFIILSIAGPALYMP